ncbi:ATP/GTP binding protein [Actinokineospora spheciospongiae]|uniref:ATP/GTP binding protein n=1 Tax=Actinokineospora spheciospongiae TaxID=909613 RepID=W7IHR2_9PSEU|nr:hypothetical protein [Actinokineospora spheciospongiae]EWC59883.1 ATP/GTP binding protein [Actinokineospora spheciospongiae]
MIVWLNGPFGAGKTSASRELTELLPRARVFDSEEVGFMLRHVLTEPVADFQDWPAWRALVVHTAAEVLSQVGGTLVVPQTVLDRSYAEEIFAGLRGASRARDSRCARGVARRTGGVGSADHPG